MFYSMGVLSLENNFKGGEEKLHSFAFLLHALIFLLTLNILPHIKKEKTVGVGSIT